MTKPTRWTKICGELLLRIRDRHPLVHHITNFVVMNDTANATLALGATPVMAHAKAEVAEMVYYGFWYHAKLDALMAFIRQAQEAGRIRRPGADLDERQGKTGN